MSAKVNVRIPTTQNGTGAQNTLQQSAQDSNWAKWFLPHQETQVVAKTESKGIFIPWPLLAIIVTLAIVLISGLVTLEVQVSNLSTTLLLRDRDYAEKQAELKIELTKAQNKSEQLMVYIQNDREKLVSIQTKLGIKQ